LRFLLKSDRIDAGQRSKLAEILFSQDRSLYFGGGAMCFIAALCWMRTGSPFWPAWAAAAAGVVAARLWLANRYKHRSDGAPGPEIWAKWFAVGASGSALLLSAAVVYSMTRDDTHVQLFVITLQFAYLGGAVGRNAASPVVVASQVAITCPPTAAACLFSSDPAYHAYAALPLMAMAGYREIARFQGQVLLDALVAKTEQVAANLKLSEACNSLVRANTQLARLSSTDALTGIANRRAFDIALQSEWSRAVREGACLSLLLFDVDYFKAYNDHLGHPAGDMCLKRIAETLNDGLTHPLDLIARIGGEEFAALLPGTEAAGAHSAGERLMMQVAACEMAHERSAFGYVSVSVGAASIRPRPGDDAATLLHSADTALYRAKQDGRNCLRGCEKAAAAMGNNRMLLS
jgi:diguanylate cyclase (GGDEF)-like protein